MWSMTHDRVDSVFRSVDYFNLSAYFPLGIQRKPIKVVCTRDIHTLSDRDKFVLLLLRGSILV